MKKTGKKLLTFMLAAAVAMGSMLMPVQTASAATAEMKKAKVTWDLKNNKTVAFKTYYAGLGMVNQKGKITGLKVANYAGTTGYKQCTFTVNITRNFKMSKNQVDKCVAAAKKANGLGATAAYHAVDYDSGKFLATGNKKKVVVRQTAWTNTKVNKYTGTGGTWLQLADVKVTVQIIYPSNYKGLCVGLGGMTKLNMTANDSKYAKGQLSINKTNFVSKSDKKVAHFMRVK